MSESIHDNIATFLPRDGDPAPVLSAEFRGTGDETILTTARLYERFDCPAACIVLEFADCLARVRVDGEAVALMVRDRGGAEMEIMARAFRWAADALEGKTVREGVVDWPEVAA